MRSEFGWNNWRVGLAYTLMGWTALGCSGDGGPPEADMPPDRQAGDNGTDSTDASPGFQPEAEGGAEIDAGGEAACPAGYEMGDFYGKPTVEVRIGELGPFVFIYDTGAPYSGIDDTLSEIVGDGPHRIEVGGQTIELNRLAAFDPDALGFDGIWGILGADVMSRFIVTLDSARSRFWLNQEHDEAALLACDHVRRDPVETDITINGYLYVRGSAEDEEGWFLVDSGASLGVMPDSLFDTLQARRSRPYLVGFHTPAAIGTFWARLTTIAHLEVAGRRVANIATRTLPDGLLPGTTNFADGGRLLGVLPSGYLRHFLITIDHARRQLRLDAYGDMPLEEPPSYFPVGIGLSETVDPPVTVAQVLAGSSAEEQGVQVGDEVVRIEGYDVGSLTPSQRAWAFVRPSAGETVEVTLQPGTDPERTITVETSDLLTAPLVR